MPVVNLSKGETIALNVRCAHPAIAYFVNYLVEIVNTLTAKLVSVLIAQNSMKNAKIVIPTVAQNVTLRVKMDILFKTALVFNVRFLIEEYLQQMIINVPPNVLLKMGTIAMTTVVYSLAHINMDKLAAVAINRDVQIVVNMGRE